MYNNFHNLALINYCIEQLQCGNCDCLDKLDCPPNVKQLIKNLYCCKCCDDNNDGGGGSSGFDVYDVPHYLKHGKCTK